MLVSKFLGSTSSRESSRSRLTPVALPSAALVTLLFGAGCGNSYRPVVSAINPVGPASQATKYAIALSSPSPTSNGLLTIIDFAGDTILSTPAVLANPNYLALAAGGAEGFAINLAGSFNEFPTSNPTTLLTSTIVQSTLPVAAAPVTISVATLSGQATSVFVPEAGRSRVAILNTSGSLQQEVAIASSPTYVVATEGAARAYVLSPASGPPTALSPRWKPEPTRSPAPFPSGPTPSTAL